MSERDDYVDPTPPPSLGAQDVSLLALIAFFLAGFVYRVCWWIDSDYR